MATHIDISTLLSVIDNYDMFSTSTKELHFLVLGDSRKLLIIFTIDSFDGIIDNFYIKNANVNVTPTLLPPQKKKFFIIFSENDTILEKIIVWRTMRYLISHKKGYTHFHHQTPPSLQEELGLQKQFFAIFSENTVFFRKTVK